MKNPKTTRRALIIGAAVAALTVGGVGGVAWATNHRSVTVEVDGQTVPVSGFFTNVDAALNAAGVEVGEHDVVAPSRDAALNNGETVVVRTADPYTIRLDGKASTAWSAADTMSDRVTEVSADNASATVPADRSATRTVLPLAAEQTSVTVRVDGKDIKVDAAPADSADEILARANIVASNIDRVAFKQEGKTLVLQVSRVSRTTDKATEKLPRPTNEVEDPKLEKGTEEVREEGADGSVERATYVETIDGKKTVEVKLAEKRTEPKPKVVAVGTKDTEAEKKAEEEKKKADEEKAAAEAENNKPAEEDPKPAEDKPAEPAPAPPAENNNDEGGNNDSGGNDSGAVGGDVWAALAQCESGGNPSTNTGNGYYGLYQFSESTWHAMGGSGLPSDASAEEQTMRAQKLQAQAGWGQWPACAAKLGLL